jgi:hypothetical protein
LFIVEVLVDIIGYYTAKVLLPLVSVGWIRVDAWSSEKPGGWFGCYRDEDRRLVFTATMAGWVGVFLWLLALVIFIVAIGR